mgnify:CR=1 FL=1
MNYQYIVRFVRKDGKPAEEYYYPDLQDAQYHFELFQDDDSGLYDRIEITDFSELKKLVKVHLFT